MKTASHSNVIIPALVFAIALHGALNVLVGVPIGFFWLAAVLGCQCLIILLRLAGKVSAPFALTGAALSAVVVDLFAAVLFQAGAGDQPGIRTAGGAAALAVAFGFLWLSYSLATSPGFDFSPSRASHGKHGVRAGEAGQRDPTSMKAAMPAAVPEPKPIRNAAAQEKVPEAVPAVREKTPRRRFFRIVNDRDGQLLAACPCADLAGSMDLAAIQGFLPDYDPSSLCVIKVSLATDDSVVIRVDGRLRSDRETYRLLEPPKE